MLSAALAFVGALVYGSADFLGGLASRHLRAVVVTATAATSGLAVLLVSLPVLGGVWAPRDVLWGALSGVTGAVAIGLLYACLAIGPMSVLSPVTAVVSAVAPILWAALVKGEALSPLGILGIALAIVAVVLVAFLPTAGFSRPSALGLTMAFGSGLAIGAFLILIDQTSDASGVVPLIMNRAVNALITGAVVVALIVIAARRGARARDALIARTTTSTATSSVVRRAWLLAVACGLVDAVANLLLLTALRSGGDLSVVAALTALYPAGTVILAALVLRERIAPAQWAGLVLALVAGAILGIAP
ncbi:DMT family transporter [Microbacterium sp. W1N]|uniref:DMT family transporter n=1 Tax=Microbacterium festucae TaxID=2977531 RepID=UPI0021C052CD|nr:DMT family transporter [Microbacterium festucae]MCT9821011.1 DMT family transporter [Microbacterium festucae]